MENTFKNEIRMRITAARNAQASRVVPTLQDDILTSMRQTATRGLSDFEYSDVRLTPAHARDYSKILGLRFAFKIQDGMPTVTCDFDAD